MNKYYDDGSVTALAPKRKWLTAVSFGIIGLVFSPYSFCVNIDGVLISMPWSITFPILIAMAYGWRYGFLAGISGSAFYPFLLWPNNGYPNVMTFLIVLGFYTSLGFISYSKPDDKYGVVLLKLFQILLVNIILMWVVFHSLFIPLLSFNPPFWRADAIKSLDSHLLTSFAIKDSINYVLIALLAEMLLRLPLIRKFMGLPSTLKMKFNHKIFFISLLAAIIIGFILLSLDYALLKRADHSYHELLLLAFIVICWSGIIVARIIIVFSEKRIESENELQKAYDRIKESQEEVNSLINALPDLIFVLNKEYLFLECYSNENDNFYFNPREYIGKKVTDVLPKKIAEELCECINKIFITGEMQNYKFSIKLNGEIKYFEARIVLKGEDTCLSIVSDVTKQTQAELERQVLYEITDGITTTANLNALLKLIHQSLGKVVYAENCFVALYDEKTELFSFPYFVDKLDSTPEPFALHRSCTAYTFKSGKPLLLTQESFDKLVEQDEVELVGTNSPSWVGIPLQTPSKTIGVLVLQHYEKDSVYSERDVKFLSSVGSQIAIAIERKRAEEELKESEDRFRAIFEQAAVGVALLNTRTGQYIRINQKYCDLIGYTKQEMLQKKLMDITHFQDIKTNLDRNYQLIEGNHREFSLEKRYVHKNGEIIWGNLTISPLWKPGETPEEYLHIAIVEDITERKKSELMIQQQNKQLVELNSTKDKFFSIIAHDLKSPFQGFLGMTKLISENINEFSSEEVSQHTKKLNQSAQNLYKLLQNLLDWSRVQNGKMDFIPEVFSLKKLIDQNIKTLEQRIMQKRISMNNEVPDTQKVFVDEMMINSTIGNLLSNAIKFSKSGGKVIIRAKSISDKLLEVSVSDTGIGMTDKTIKKLFKIDEKVGREGTDGEPTTGLGLLLCKEFVEKHGGTIWVESEEGKGSTFTFTIHEKVN
ncbi:MAG: PAS domain S-box protein [Ignavibacteria bacterium]|nr:PAS domain S-box protein [Ignavibacteria bacterium]